MKEFCQTVQPAFVILPNKLSTLNTSVRSNVYELKRNPSKKNVHDSLMSLWFLSTECFLNGFWRNLRTRALPHTKRQPDTAPSLVIKVLVTDKYLTRYGRAVRRPKRL